MASVTGAPAAHPSDTRAFSFEMLPLFMIKAAIGAIEVEEAAGVLHGIGVIVRVDDPVVIICKPESHGANVPPLVGSGVKETHYQAQEIRLPETGLFH